MMTMCLYFMWNFTNDVELKFDVVPVALSVCVIWGEGGLGFGFWNYFWLVCPISGIGFFLIGASL